MTFMPATPARSRFRLEQALQSTFEAVFAGFGVFVALALVIYALPNLLLTLPFGPTPGTGSLVSVVMILVRGVANLALSAVLQGALVRGVIGHLNGEKPRFGPCLRSGLSAALPLVAIGLIAGVGVGFGLLLLIAPGLFLLSLWSVVAPAQVMERRGVFASFSRSAELTEGHRWAVLGALLIMFVLAGLVGVVGTGLAGVLAVTMGGGLAAALGYSWPLFVVSTLLTVLTSAVGSLLTSTLPAALYFHLRGAREGAAPGAAGGGVRLNGVAAQRRSCLWRRRRPNSRSPSSLRRSAV